MEDKRGCIKTKFIVNFRKPDENLVKDTAHLFDNDKIAPNIASISIEFLKNLRPSFISPDLTASLNNVLNEVLFGFSDKDFLQSILSNNLDKMVSLSSSEKLSLFDLKFLEEFPNVQILMICWLTTFKVYLICMKEENCQNLKQS